MSLDRLIRLARRTGDRLIVHDSAGDADLVIMDVDSYERLLDLETVPDDRSWLEPEPWERKGEIEETVGGFDEFGEDDMPWDKPSPWYSAGDVLGEKKSDPKSDSWTSARDTLDEIKIEDVPFSAEALVDDWANPSANTLAASTGLSGQSLPIPPAHTTPLPSTWGEEPLAGDEPVFYEEPV